MALISALNNIVAVVSSINFIVPIHIHIERAHAMWIWNAAYWVSWTNPVNNQINCIMIGWMEEEATEKTLYFPAQACLLNALSTHQTEVVRGYLHETFSTHWLYQWYSSWRVDALWPKKQITANWQDHDCLLSKKMMWTSSCHCLHAGFLAKLCLTPHSSVWWVWDCHLAHRSTALL